MLYKYTSIKLMYNFYISVLTHVYVLYIIQAEMYIKNILNVHSMICFVCITENLILSMRLLTAQFNICSYFIYYYFILV